MVFIIIWFGQLISLIGSGLTGFSLGVWIYQRTGSTTQFALVAFFSVLPSILVSPIAGALIDRWDRRKAMILSDCGAGLSTLLIAVLLFTGRLETWAIYILMLISSTFGAFRWPAFSAMTTMLVPRRHLGRSSGMIQVAEATAQIVSPVLAGALIAMIQIHGVVLIDFTSFLFALITLLFVRVPRPEVTEEHGAAKGSLLREAAFGWTYIVARPGLFALLIFFALMNLIVGFVVVLLTPMVLSFASAKVLGTILSISGSGMLIGGLVMSVWGGPKRRIYGLFGFAFLQGLLLFLAGLQPDATLIAIAGFFFLFGASIVNASSQAIWQIKVEPALQGRVFAIRRMIAWSTLPLAYLIAGPLADRLFQPLLVVGGPLAGTVGRIIGVGQGRGIALLFIIMGFFILLTVSAGYLYKPLRLVEDELPPRPAEDLNHPIKIAVR